MLVMGVPPVGPWVMSVDALEAQFATARKGFQARRGILHSSAPPWQRATLNARVFFGSVFLGSVVGVTHPTQSSASGVHGRHDGVERKEGETFVEFHQRNEF